MIEATKLDPGTGPSTKSYALVNPNDASQQPNNSDVVPVGTGPSNEASGGTVDPYLTVIRSNP